MHSSANLTRGRLIGAAIIAGIWAGMLAARSAPAPKPTDDWRRTSRGWERVSAWSTTSSSSPFPSDLRPLTSDLFASSPPSPAPRLSHHKRRSDTHPAALALAQLITSLLALAIFSPRGRALFSETSLFTLLSRSFRASVFGS